MEHRDNRVQVALDYLLQLLEVLLLAVAEAVAVGIKQFLLLRAQVVAAVVVQVVLMEMELQEQQILAEAVAEVLDTTLII